MLRLIILTHFVLFFHIISNWPPVDLQYVSKFLFEFNSMDYQARHGHYYLQTEHSEFQELNDKKKTHCFKALLVKLSVYIVVC